MFDPKHADPRPIRFTRPPAEPSELGVDSINLGLRLALLTNGIVVPITRGFDWDGEECGFDDKRLHGFVCGSDETGWWWRCLDDFLFQQLFH